MRRERLERLRPFLDDLLGERDQLATRLEVDPVRFPRRYRADPLDAELVGLLAASLAYGRASLFGAKLEALLEILGPHPSRFARGFEAGRDMPRLNIGYRFNTPADIAALIAAAGRIQAREGSLGAAFARHLDPAGGILGALQGFVATLRGALDPRIEEVGPTRFRALSHLLPNPASGSACKRWMLYLRWMVRGGGADPIDLGLWALDPALLVIPLDTHIARLSRRLGLTRRSDASFATALEITEALAQLDPADPIKYDFALCHLGMSGRCPAHLSSEDCRICPLRAGCRTGIMHRE